MAIKGLIFDFDGLILDTETPEFEEWQAIYLEHSVDLPMNVWAAGIGTHEAAFDPATYMETLLGRPVDHTTLRAEQRQRSLERIRQQSPRPGISEILRSAREAGLKLGVASSSPVSWVHSFLQSIGLYAQFDAIVCRDHVERVKPFPDLFLRCAQELGIEPAETIVFEDSPNGLRAAINAGIFCVAIPNPVTLQLDLSHANLILSRADAIPWAEVLRKAE
jgi:HAD superfamily hydrolase (TIGR01509 family)